MKHFHGDEYSTNSGSSYNSYLVRDEKTALIDTVWQPYDTEFVERPKEEIDLHAIDYIVMNHNEIDHSGALPELMREIPDTPIYRTKKGEAILFSNDGFGQHFASESLFNDTVDQSRLYAESEKYYANILTLYSANVTKKIKEVLSLNLPLAMIAPSHGVIWRDNPAQIVEKYLEWADAIAEGIQNACF